MLGEVQETTTLDAAAVRPLTAVTALAWYDGRQNIRLYYQDTAGRVVEACGTDGSWVPGAVLTGAAPGSKLATTTWRDGGGVHIRLYYQDARGALGELCYDDGDGWYTGRLAVTGAAPGTGIAAVSWRNPEGDVHIRVYYQDTASNLAEQCNDHGVWTVGGLSQGTGTLSTGIAAAQWTDDAGFHIRVYWVDADILSYPVVALSSYDNGQWTVVSLTKIITDDASELALLQWTDGPGRGHQRIAYQASLSVIDHALDNDVYAGHAFGAPPAPGTGIALARFTDSAGDHVRLFYQSPQNAILEYAQDFGAWQDQPTVVTAG
jgi:hypothetical protein